MSSPLNTFSACVPPSFSSRYPLRNERPEHPRRPALPSGDGFTRAATSASLPRFQGQHATELANSGFLLNPGQLKAVMDKEKDHHYGYNPDVVTQAFGRPEKEIRATLDAVGKQLHASRLARGESMAVNFKKGTPAQLDYLNEGHTSVVYKLTVNDTPFALKVFRPGTAGTDIPYADVVNGACLNAHNAKDASRLYMANPAKNWTLMEYIGPEATLEQRTGQTMAEMGIANSDEGPKNRINGILIDHGGTLTVPNDCYPDEQSFKDVLKRIDSPSLLKRLLK